MWNDRNPELSGRPRLRWREPMPDRNSWEKGEHGTEQARGLGVQGR